jgi:hypothetical protein
MVHKFFPSEIVLLSHWRDVSELNQSGKATECLTSTIYFILKVLKKVCCSRTLLWSCSIDQLADRLWNHFPSALTPPRIYISPMSRLDNSHLQRSNLGFVVEQLERVLEFLVVHHSWLLKKILIRSMNHLHTLARRQFIGPFSILAALKVAGTDNFVWFLTKTSCKSSKFIRCHGAAQPRIFYGQGRTLHSLKHARY